jgi:hypothetical protein
VTGGQSAGNEPRSIFFQRAFSRCTPFTRFEFDAGTLPDLKFRS